MTDPMTDACEVYLGHTRVRASFTAAHTEGRVLFCVLGHAGREYRFAFDYGRLRFIRLTTPEMRDRRISQLLLERDFWGNWHLEQDAKHAPFGEDLPFVPHGDVSVRTLTDLAYSLVKQAHQTMQEQGIICWAALKRLITKTIAFDFKALEAERSQAQTLRFNPSIILPPFADPRLCFPVMEGCRKRSVYGPCSFCDTFSTRPFRILSFAEILDYARQKLRWLDGRVKSGYELFITEGEALAAPLECLEAIIHFLEREFPDIPRISAFASVLNIIGGEGGEGEAKSLAKLQRLRQIGLSRIYLGIESGSDLVLRDMNKQVSRKEQLTAAAKVREAGLELACMIISGYGGRELYREHLEGCVEFLNQGRPHRVFFSRITSKPATAYWSRGYTPLSRAEMEAWEREVQSRVSGEVIFRQYTQVSAQQSSLSENGQKYDSENSAL